MFFLFSFIIFRSFSRKGEKLYFSFNPSQNCVLKLTHLYSVVSKEALTLSLKEYEKENSSLKKTSCQPTLPWGLGIRQMNDFILQTLSQGNNLLVGLAKYRYFRADDNCKTDILWNATAASILHSQLYSRWLICYDYSGGLTKEGTDSFPLCCSCVKCL